MGRVYLDLRKKKSPSRWKKLSKHRSDKHQNIQVWWEIYEKYEKELDDLEGQGDDADRGQGGDYSPYGASSDSGKSKKTKKKGKKKKSKKAKKGFFQRVGDSAYDLYKKVFWILTLF